MNRLYLYFDQSLLYQRKYSKNHMLNHNNLFTIIDSFQRYILSDKSIVLNKEDSKHD
jgi:hypothetical protein